mmetsp:Transcript_26704/g.53637  ORF Transcript_26704/g.53637 Transcript_26704/m.53637 type:complete len:357 (-) Transcript_26704:488-1558(-)
MAQPLGNHRHHLCPQQAQPPHGYAADDSIRPYLRWAEVNSLNGGSEVACATSRALRKVSPPTMGSHHGTECLNLAIVEKICTHEKSRNPTCVARQFPMAGRLLATPDASELDHCFPEQLSVRRVVFAEVATRLPQQIAGKFPSRAGAATIIRMRVPGFMPYLEQCVGEESAQDMATCSEVLATIFPRELIFWHAFIAVAPRLSDHLSREPHVGFVLLSLSLALHRTWAREKGQDTHACSDFCRRRLPICKGCIGRINPRGRVAVIPCNLEAALLPDGLDDSRVVVAIAKKCEDHAAVLDQCWPCWSGRRSHRRLALLRSLAWRGRHCQGSTVAFGGNFGGSFGGSFGRSFGRSRLG